MGHLYSLLHAVVLVLETLSGLLPVLKSLYRWPILASGSCDVMLVLKMLKSNL